MNKIKNKVKVLFTLLLLGTISIHAQTIQVQPNQMGNIQNIINSNSIIEFERGKVYEISINISINQNGKILRAYGSGSKPILRMVSERNDFFGVKANDVTFDELNLQAKNKTTYDASVIKVKGNYKNLKVTNCDISAASGGTIRMGINSNNGGALDGFFCENTTFSDISDVVILIMNRNTERGGNKSTLNKITIRGCTFNAGYVRGVICDNGNDFYPSSEMVNGTLVQGLRRYEYATDLQGSVIENNTFYNCEKWHIGFVQVKNVTIRNNIMMGPFNNQSRTYAGCIHLEQFDSDIRIHSNTMTNNLSNSRGFVDLAAKEGIRRVDDNEEPLLLTLDGGKRSGRGYETNNCSGYTDKNCKRKIHRYGPRRIYIWDNTFNSNKQLTLGIIAVDAETFWIGRDTENNVKRNTWNTNSLTRKVRLLKGHLGNCDIKIEDDISRDQILPSDMSTVSLNGSDNCVMFKETDTSLSTNENELDNERKFIFYPNPTNGTIIIESPFTEPFSLEFYSISGVLVKSMHINGKMPSYKVDISGISKGIYFLSFKSGKLATSKRLIIK